MLLTTKFIDQRAGVLAEARFVYYKREENFTKQNINFYPVFFFSFSSIKILCTQNFCHAFLSKPKSNYIEKK